MNLSDIAELNPTRKLKKGTIAPFVEMASLPVNARDIENISEKEFKGGGSKFKNNDTLFARITPCLENGKTAKVSGLEEDEIGFGSTEFIVLSAKNSTDEDYLYYLARLPEFRSYAQSRMEGTSGRQRVSWQALAEFNFQFPDADTREKSAKILKNFDDKIQLNNETNQTLEHIAQAIFKSWFIDFDPVHSKANALAQGLDENTANRHAMMTISGKTETQLAEMEKNSPQDFAELKATAEAFPSGFDDEGLPLGWDISTIGDEVETVGGATPSTKNQDYWDNGNIHWTTPKDLSNSNDKILLDTDRKITELGLQKISSGLLPINTVLMSSRAPVGYLALAKVPVAINQGYIAMKCDKQLSCFYILQWCNANMEEIKVRSSGTTFKEISKKNFRTINCIVPNAEVLSFYNTKLEFIYDKMENNILQNKWLEETRDTLLPRLLSGEIL